MLFKNWNKIKTIVKIKTICIKMNLLKFVEKISQNHMGIQQRSMS